MVQITKVYTKLGDNGMTHLAGGHRVAKTHPRIIAIGHLDELNSFLGFAAQALAENDKTLYIQIVRIQNELFNLGAELSVLDQDRRKDTPHIKANDTTRLEGEIDKMNATLPPLKSFILPGGGEFATRLHMARAICRRAEITLFALTQEMVLNNDIFSYINRLSDWLFVAARFSAHQQKIAETLWKPQQGKD